MVMEVLLNAAIIAAVRKLPQTYMPINASGQRV